MLRLTPRLRAFSTSARSLAGSTGPATSRAIIFREHGDPSKVLEGLQYRLPALQKGEVRVRFELGAVNPADVNVIQGVYPAKPAAREDIAEGTVYIMGNEGTGIVEGFQEDGKVENAFKVGDRVVMGAAQLGTWQSLVNLPHTSLIPVKSTPAISPSQAATLSINPPTALRMLSDFVPLDPTNPERSSKKQWVIQNGANSAVGIAAIQIAKSWDVGTINLVRNRDNIDGLKSQLRSLGADHVLTYDEFLDRDKRKEIKSWIGEGELKLALNCVGGKETTEMVKLLGLDGVLVTYGGMAKQALSVPPSLFIFKKLTATGFWLSNWVKTHSKERLGMMENLAQLVADGKLLEPETEVVEVKGDEQQMGEIVRGVMLKHEGGKGRKVLLQFVED